MKKKWLIKTIITAQLFCISTVVKAEQLIDAKVSAFKSDIQELAERIKNVHPRPFRMISNANFDLLVEEKLAEINSTTDKKDVLWSFSEIIASVGCGHTRMSYFNQEKKLIDIKQRFPLEVRFFDDQLVIIDTLSNSTNVEKGDFVTQINGKNPKQILNEIYKHISTDAYLPFYKRHQFNAYATSYLTYALGFPDKYEIVTQGTPQVIRLSPLNEYTPKPIISPLASCQKTLCYQVEETFNTGILTLRSFNFYGSAIDSFKSFVDNAFDDLVHSNRDSLIIDIRGNQGGTNEASSYLLRNLHDSSFQFYSSVSDKRGASHLFAMQTPLNKNFRGKVFVLMDGNTVSSVPHFLSLVKEHDLAKLVGEPAGGNKSTNDGSQKFKSTHLGIEYSIARMRFDVHAPSIGIDDPILPDIDLPYTKEQIITGKDLMLDELLDIIQTKI